ncbi:hypothetical protein [Burkholderia stabilis]|uniref:hypothetical protein n=1 Tax=Burkholderia stabilis TaxID=95485 RepID=UPI001F4B5A5C|nr:hypothetical protein [Burkholderia stabilis]
MLLLYREVTLTHVKREKHFSERHSFPIEKFHRNRTQFRVVRQFKKSADPEIPTS